MEDKYEQYEKTRHVKHGQAFDRGMADSYYGRPQDPHIWPEGTYNGKRTEKADMTPDEIIAYNDGYEWNETMGDKKQWL